MEKNPEMATDSTEVTYVLCPDSTCDGFFAQSMLCKECPLGCRFMIICPGCKTEIILSSGHSQFCRVDCLCGACSFQRMTGVWRRIDIWSLRPAIDELFSAGNFMLSSARTIPISKLLPENDPRHPRLTLKNLTMPWTDWPSSKMIKCDNSRWIL